MRSRVFHATVATAGLILVGTIAVQAQHGEGVNPYWPGLDSPKLITPQWIGEEGVEAAILLSIDDMRDPAKYEAFCRPILNRLKEIDGRAPFTIFTNVVDPMEPQLQSWLKEGLSIEVHTIDHPCPLLAKGDFAQAKKTVHDCIDLLAGIPGMKPVAYRMPCCDSMNSVSPRFFSEIFNVPTESGNFLQIDSSVFTLMTPADPDLPAELIGEGAGRFAKYVPKLKGFVNYTENYPYPYVIGGSCWQLPCVVPSDWEAQDRQGVNNPQTVADMMAAIDATVIKKGVFTLVFHPHGWIRNDQIVELIDHAVAKHGKKVKFLNMRETLERLTANFLGGTPIRDPETGKPNEKLAILDSDGDGLMDVSVRTDAAGVVRRDLDGDGIEEIVAGHPDGPGVYRKAGDRWQKLPFTLPYRTAATTPDGKDAGLRFADVNGDGHDDVIFSNHERYSVHLWVSMDAGWAVAGLSGMRGDFAAEQEIPMIVREDGSDNGVWFNDGRMFVQNEDTAKENTVVEQRTFEQLATALTKPEAVVNLQPTPADRALSTMRTHDRFEVQLVAAEPLVMDPIDIAWGPDGKLWVVEMGDYPLGEDGKGKPYGRVRFLEDGDGDGSYEKSTLFLDGLAYPSGVMPWKDGVLILAAPNLLYARDVNGDGVCDTREVLYDGFLTGNPQHLANGLAWGLDNWIYIANGDSGGQVRSLKTGETANISGRDLRLRPETGALDAQSGMTQFSRPRDDWGNWFGCNNSYPLWHYVLHDHYLRRNPHVATPSPSIRITDPELHPQVYPASPTIERFNDYHTANRITSACGAGIYRDSLLGEDLYGNAFICEPVHNLVYRQVLSQDGYTFKARRPDEELQSEFLASTDNWFRPVTARTGPDGALYVVDMYRHVIEHPEWIPPEWEEKLDLRAGSDRGRIYRVVKRGTSPRKRRSSPG
ncbi:MAG: FG-GAP-like repeat-containing protein [Verrucomicrobiales bacterium]